MKCVFGSYYRDQNFTWLFDDSEERMYTFARGCSDWGSIKVGDTAHVGGTFTKECYESTKNDHEGPKQYGLFCVAYDED